MFSGLDDSQGQNSVLDSQEVVVQARVSSEMTNRQGHKGKGRTTEETARSNVSTAIKDSYYLATSHKLPHDERF